MKYISFAYTTPCVQARCKDVTRREWDDDYAARFPKGEVVGALDKLFRGDEFWVVRFEILEITRPLEFLPHEQAAIENLQNYLRTHPYKNPA